MNIVLYRIQVRLLNAAKAIVAAATPIASLAITEVIADLNNTLSAGIAAAVTSILVYVTKNQPK
jgi:hypothetical protein